MKNFFNSRLKIIIAVTFIVIIGIIIYFSTTPPSPEKPLIIPPATPSPFPSETANSLTITKTTPKSTTFLAGETRNPIMVYFNQPVNASFAIVSSNPALLFETKVNPDNLNRLILQPTTPWQTDTIYRVTLKSGLKSLDNQYTLNKDVTLEFTTQSISRPVYDRPS
ncbi:MAG: Ig-like domain-containing protein [Candidatus Chisholmbacteria bacterium]|nr:Ig-like domain-containing protein [Candidatus Chisholmbacteria bacterium]